MEAILEFRTSKDARNRITLKGDRLSDFYEALVFENGEILLKPRVLVSPDDVVSAKTQRAIGRAVESAQKQTPPEKLFDPKKFADLLDNEESSG